MRNGIGDIRTFERELNRWNLHLGFIVTVKGERRLCITDRPPKGKKIKAVTVRPFGNHSLQIDNIHSHQRVNGIDYYDLLEFDQVIRGSESKTISLKSFDNVVDQLFRIFAQ